MAFTGSTGQVRVEDLSPVLIMADVRNTPITSRMRKGEKLKDLEYSWPAEKSPNRLQGGRPENQDVKGFEGSSQVKLRNRAEKFWRTPRVSTEAEEVVQTESGSKGRYNREKVKFIKAEKRDCETDIASDQESFEGDPVRGYGFKGFGRVINDGTLPFTDVPMTIPTGFRTPTAQIYTGTIANFLETVMTDMMQSRWDLLGATTELMFFVASALKRQISDIFGNYKADKTGFTLILRRETPTLDQKRLQLQGIDLIDTDFGQIEVVLVPFMPTNARGYGVDMDQVFLRPLFWCRHTQLPYLGGGRSGLIESIIGWEFGDPRGHFKVAPSDEVSRTTQNDGN